jgi:hypothetical protein
MIHLLHFTRGRGRRRVSFVMLGTNRTINPSAETAMAAEAGKSDEEEELNIPLLLLSSTCCVSTI